MLGHNKLLIYILLAVVLLLFGVLFLLNRFLICSIFWTPSQRTGHGFFDLILEAADVGTNLGRLLLLRYVTLLNHIAILNVSSTILWLLKHQASV